MVSQIPFCHNSVCWPGIASCLAWCGCGCIAWEAWPLGLRPQPGELDPTPLPASRRPAQACSQGHWTPQTAGSHAHAFRTLLCPIGQRKSRGQAQLEKGEEVTSLQENRSGQVTLQTGVHTGWAHIVAVFCNLPHLSLIKAFGFTNVVSPGFQVHFIVVG